MRRASFLLRSIYALCLLGATFNHTRILLRHGFWWDYGGVAWPSAAYWTSLTFLDPLVVLLLLIRPSAGILGTIVLIATNVAHNLAITSSRAQSGAFASAIASNPFLLSQIAFLLFVAVTAPIACRGVRPQAAKAASGAA